MDGDGRHKRSACQYVHKVYTEQVPAHNVIVRIRLVEASICSTGATYFYVWNFVRNNIYQPSNSNCTRSRAWVIRCGLNCVWPTDSQKRMAWHTRRRLVILGEPLLFTSHSSQKSSRINHKNTSPIPILIERPKYPKKESLSYRKRWPKKLYQTGLYSWYIQYMMTKIPKIWSIQVRAPICDLQCHNPTSRQLG